VAGEGWTAVNNDCVAETRTMAAKRRPDRHLDPVRQSLRIFGELRGFRAHRRHDHFFEQMDYLTPELLRVLRPGRLAFVHVKDRIRFAAVTGLARPTVDPFHAQTIEHFRRHGFAYAACASSRPTSCARITRPIG
jgi:hypothetical protein